SSTEVAKFAGMLRDAARLKGNFGIGSATRMEADVLGYAWVGDGWRWSSDGKAMVSADGLRVYRPPSWKPDLGKYPANLEWKVEGISQPQGNAHIDILE